MPRALPWAATIVGAITLLWLGRVWLIANPLAAGLAAYEQGAWGMAEAQARKRLAARPDDREAWRLLARAAGRQGHDITAQTIYRQRLGLDAMTAEDYVIAASGLARMGQTDQATIALGKARARDPSHPETLHDLATLDLAANRLAEAAELAGRLRTRPGWERRACLIESQVAEALDDPAAVARSLQRALELDTEGTDPSAGASANALYKRLARALIQTRRPADARAQLVRVLAGGPDAETSWLLSRALLQEGDLTAAGLALAAADGYAKRDPTLREPAPFAGAARCQACHPQHFRNQQSSRHAQTYVPTRSLARLPALESPVPDPGDSRIRHVMNGRNGELLWESTGAADHARAIVDYAFGSGFVAVTFVGRDSEGTERELRLSYYGAAAAWDVTTGHLSQPKDPREFLGRDLGRDGVRRCFECHTTSARSARLGDGTAAADHGIGCERCHGPGAHHLDAVEHNFPDLAIARPRLASARQLMDLCSACHSPKDAKLAPGDHLAPRFASTSLAWAACYTDSRGGLSCVSCHDPHKNAETSPAFYEARCLACHSNTPSGAAGVRPATHRFPVRHTAVRYRVCPVQKASGCLDCHMPKIEGIVPHARFTDHHIRVRRDRPPNPPARDTHAG
jgi:tetratricopeptide (TPR) repeat protein